MFLIIKHKTGSKANSYRFPRRPPSSIQHHGGKEYAAKNLFMLAVGILNLPTSSASVERSFSQHSNIHSLPRNRLTNQRADKLLFISHNFKVLNPKNNQKKILRLIPTRKNNLRNLMKSSPRLTLKATTYSS